MKKNINADDFAANYVSLVQILLAFLIFSITDLFINYFTLISLNQTKVGFAVLLLILFFVNDRRLKKKYRELTDNQLDELCDIDVKYIPVVMLLIPFILFISSISLSF